MQLAILSPSECVAGPQSCGQVTHVSGRWPAWLTQTIAAHGRKIPECNGCLSAAAVLREGDDLARVTRAIPVLDYGILWTCLGGFPGIWVAVATLSAICDAFAYLRRRTFPITAVAIGGADVRVFAVVTNTIWAAVACPVNTLG